jgi:hypothetical protein
VTQRLSRAAISAGWIAGLAALLTALAPRLEPRVLHAQNALPNLIVRQDILAHNWIVRVENLPATFCSVQEGEVTPGEHTLLRFSVSTPNIGAADLALGDPNAHVAANDGLYEFATCHNHYHFRHYALYQLIDPNSGFVWRAAKRGFCMIDVQPAPAYFGIPPGPAQFKTCGQIGVPGNQGISSGHADEYVWKLGGQYFVLDGGDGQPVIPPGQYILRITVNPPFVPQPGENLKFASIDPSTGLYHMLAESNYADNVAEVLVTIPDHPGKQAVGSLANTSQANAPASDDDEHDPPVK